MNQRIGLIDVDGGKFPNLALMKLSAYHKSQGDEVEWVEPMYWDYDRVYQSKIFTFSKDIERTFPCEVVRGGTGYDLHAVLPSEIDRLQPDYSIYSQVDKRTAYGFLTRGCPNKCVWCIVPLKEGNVHPYMDIDEITLGGQRPNVCLMDNNILACDYGIEQLVKIADKGYRIDLNQGNSARLVTEDVAELFARIRWIGSMIRFAADTPRQLAEVDAAMARIDKHREALGKKPAQYLVYTMIGGDINECYDRLMYFRGNKRMRIVAQPFRDFNNPKQIIPQWQKDMAHWANRRELWASCDFMDFRVRADFVCKEYFQDNVNRIGIGRTCAESAS